MEVLKYIKLFSIRNSQKKKYRYEIVQNKPGHIDVRSLLVEINGFMAFFDKDGIEDTDGRKKKQLLSSIYPEKLTFDGRSFRTKRVNEGVRLICMVDKNITDGH